MTLMQAIRLMFVAALFCGPISIQQCPPTAEDKAIAFSSASDDAARRKRDDSLALIRASQTRDGGWGPYRDAPPEAFDTAIALLALSSIRTQSDVAYLIRRGRDFLIAGQQADGSWIETTRPAGGESYAQRLSTAGWATLALLSTGD